jgi:hypothetical protein
MATVHLLTQYIWPDAAPTGVYAEHLAARLEEEGFIVSLVGGQGGYRSLQRPRPLRHLVYLDHYRGRRGNLREAFAEYVSVTRAFRDYIERAVTANDLVILTSAPPNTINLAASIHRRGARAIYWLQDYYPELVRGICDYPPLLRIAFRRYWDRQLLQWDKVVKIGANLAGPEENAVVIRNWPTMRFDHTGAPESRTAIYSGNLGYAHDVELLVKTCAGLRAAGYRITIRTDGRGARHLPAWLQSQPLENDPARLREDLLRHEIHLVAANPRITQAVFPSKIWNSLAAGRQLICTGFAGAMVEELEASRRSSFHKHLDQWVRLVQEAAFYGKEAKMEAAA